MAAAEVLEFQSERGVKSLERWGEWLPNFRLPPPVPESPMQRAPTLVGATSYGTTCPPHFLTFTPNHVRWNWLSSSRVHYLYEDI